MYLQLLLFPIKISSSVIWVFFTIIENIKHAPQRHHLLIGMMSFDCFSKFKEFFVFMYFQNTDMKYESDKMNEMQIREFAWHKQTSIARYGKFFGGKTALLKMLLLYLPMTSYYLK